jgi:hypothetical protein
MHHKSVHISPKYISVSESLEIIDSTVEQLNRDGGKVADVIRAQVYTALSKTLDIRN